MKSKIENRTFFGVSQPVRFWKIEKSKIEKNLQSSFDMCFMHVVLVFPQSYKHFHYYNLLLTIITLILSTMEALASIKSQVKSGAIKTMHVFDGCQSKGKFEKKNVLAFMKNAKHKQTFNWTTSDPSWKLLSAKDRDRFKKIAKGASRAKNRYPVPKSKNKTRHVGKIENLLLAKN